MARATSPGAPRSTAGHADPAIDGAKHAAHQAHGEPVRLESTEQGGSRIDACMLLTPGHTGQLLLTGRADRSAEASGHIMRLALM